MSEGWGLNRGELGSWDLELTLFDALVCCEPSIYLVLYLLQSIAISKLVFSKTIIIWYMLPY